MKRPHAVVTGATTLTLTLGGWLLTGTGALGHVPPEIFRTGDIVFVRGTSWRSRLVLLLDKGDTDFSHVGIVRIRDGVPYVLHASPRPFEGAPQGAVREELLADFLSPSRVSQAALYRVREHPLHRVDAAAAAAAVFAARVVPFDHEFSLLSADKLYCTELIWRAYEAAGIELLSGSPPERLLPAALSKSRELRQVARFP